MNANLKLIAVIKQKLLKSSTATAEAASASQQPKTIGEEDLS
jgi:hypothetical protein